MRNDVKLMIEKITSEGAFAYLYFFYVPAGSGYEDGVCLTAEDLDENTMVPASSDLPVDWVDPSRRCPCVTSLGRITTDVDREALFTNSGLNVKEHEFTINQYAAKPFITSLPSMVGGVIDIILAVNNNYGTTSYLLLERTTIYGPLSYSSNNEEVAIKSVSIPQGLASPCVGKLDALGNRSGVVFGGGEVSATLVSTPLVAELLNDITATATTIATKSPDLSGLGWPSTGRFYLGYEEIAYTSLSGGSFAGCTRGDGAYSSGELPPSAVKSNHPSGAQILHVDNVYTYRANIPSSHNIADLFTDAAGHTLVGNYTVDRQPTYVDITFNGYPPYYISSDFQEEEQELNVNFTANVTTGEGVTGDVDDMLALTGSPEDRYAEKSPPLASVKAVFDSEAMVLPPIDSGLDNASTVHALSTCIFCLKNDGTIWCAGKNSYGVLGIGVSDYNYYTNGYIQVGSDTDWVKVATGFFVVFALKSNGTLWAVGKNYGGLLGVGDSLACISFKQVGADTDWSDIYVCNEEIVAKKTDGSIYGWGTNADRQLGIGDISPVTQPTRIGGASTGWQGIWLGPTSLFAKASDGRIWCSGWNGRGQLGLGHANLVNNLTLMSADTTYDFFQSSGAACVAHKTDGSLWSTGYNAYGQLGLGDTIDRNVFTRIGSASNWTTSITSNMSTGLSYNHFLAINSSGILFGWGRNNNGVLGLPGTSYLTPTQVSVSTGFLKVVTGFFATFVVKGTGSLLMCSTYEDFSYSSLVQIGSGYSTEISTLSLTAAGVKTDGDSLYVCGYYKEMMGVSTAYFSGESTLSPFLGCTAGIYSLPFKVSVMTAVSRSGEYALTSDSIDVKIPLGTGASEQELNIDVKAFVNTDMLSSSSVLATFVSADAIVYLLYVCIKTRSYPIRVIPSSLVVTDLTEVTPVYPPDVIVALFKSALGDVSIDGESFSQAVSFYAVNGYSLAGNISGYDKLQSAVNRVARQSGLVLSTGGGALKFTPEQVRGEAIIVTEDSVLNINSGVIVETSPVEDLINVVCLEFIDDNLDQVKRFINSDSVATYGPIEESSNVDATLLVNVSSVDSLGNSLVADSGVLKSRVSFNLPRSFLYLEVGDNIELYCDPSPDLVYSGRVLSIVFNLDNITLDVNLSCNIDSSIKSGYTVKEGIDTVSEVQDAYRGGWGYMPWGKPWGY